MNQLNRKDIIFIDGLNKGDDNISYLGYLFSLASELEFNGYTFKVLNAKSLHDYSLMAIVEELKKHEFSSIGMTTNSENIANVYKVCEAIKHSFPSIPIILGGSQVTFTDVETLEKCKCDIVIRNMGEKSLIQVLDCIVSKTIDLVNIKGITFKHNGEIIRNDEDKFLDINNFHTPLFGILSEEKYWIVPEKRSYKNFKELLDKIRKSYAFFLTGRGCPYKCAFCVEGNSKNKFIFRSINEVKKELKYFLSVTKTQYVVISDDTFTSSLQRVTELCTMIKEVQSEMHEFQWFAEGRVDILSRHPEMIGIMYDAGLRKLQVGIESGRQETLDVYNKRITLDQIEAVLKEASNYEALAIHGNIMMANPKESFNEYLVSIEYFKKLLELSKYKLDIGITYLAPFVGTPIRTNPEKYEIDILVEDFEFKSSAMAHVICKSKKMTLSEVYAMRSYTYTKLMEFFRQKIYQFSKKEILSLFNTLNDTNSGLVIVGVLKRLTSFKRFFIMATAKATIVDISGECLNYSPLRLWELEYDKENGYYFTSLKQEHFSLKNIDLQLWELASGKNTISEIFQIINFDSTSKVSLEYILSFYKKLDDNLAIVFRMY